MSSRKQRLSAGTRPLLIGSLLLWGSAMAAEADITTRTPSISPDWGNIAGTSKTQISIQVCPEPPMRRGSAIHDQLFAALRGLHADFARYQPWRPYPKLGVAELYPPKNGQTSWDFTLIDPMVEDFMAASEGRPVIFAFTTIPSWMLKTKKPDEIPSDPDQISWAYGTNTAFEGLDSTVKLFAQYQARLAAWYMRGGFRDELGRQHLSEHRYENIAYWGILDEPRAEHGLTAAQYTQIYDAVVAAVKQVVPNMKFVGLADDDTVTVNVIPDRYPYFLDRSNHAGHAAVDAIAYHFYARPDWDESAEILQHTTFKEADQLLTAASYIEAIRRKFSPTTQTIVEELGGSFLPWAETPEQIRRKPVDRAYWNLAGGMWAYLYGHLVNLGVEMIHGAELIDYPGQAASATLVDWDTGKPNARYWVLKLIHDNLGPGDKIIAQPAPDDSAAYPMTKVYSQAFVTPRGERKVLLVNKRDESGKINISGVARGTAQTVDQTTVDGPVTRELLSDTVNLSGFAVTIVTLPK